MAMYHYRLSTRSILDNSWNHDYSRRRPPTASRVFRSIIPRFTALLIEDFIEESIFSGRTSLCKFLSSLVGYRCRLGSFPIASIGFAPGSTCYLSIKDNPDKIKWVKIIRSAAPCRILSPLISPTILSQA